MAVRFSGGVSLDGQFRCSTPPNLSVKFVAVTAGSNSNIYSSPDGITWTLTASAWMPYAARGVKVMHDGTKWLIIAANALDDSRNHFATSPDGVNWTTYIVSGTPWPLGRWLGGITVSGSTYVGVVREEIYSSTNLTNWTYRASIGGTNGYNIWYNAANGALYTSTYHNSLQKFYLFVAPTTPSSWTLQIEHTLTVSSAAGYVNTANMVFTDTKKIWHHAPIAGGSGTTGPRVGAKTATSNDWATITGAPTTGNDGLAYGNGVVLISQPPGLIKRADDAENPSLNTVNAAAGGYTTGFAIEGCVNRLAFGSNRFVFVTDSGMKYSDDNGATWTLSNLTNNNIATVGSKNSI